MKSCASCATLIPGDAVFCPSCGAGPGREAPAPPPPPSASPSSSPAAFDRAAAASRVRNLGVLYMVMGGLLVLPTLANLARLALMAAGPPGGEGPGDPVLREFLEEFPGPWMVGLAAGVLPMAVAVLVFSAGMRLRSLRGRTHALVAAVPLLLGCPCSCCFLAIPLGGYALWLLTRPETIAAMEG